jgi:hypothetical protein
MMSKSDALHGDDVYADEASVSLCKFAIRSDRTSLMLHVMKQNSSHISHCMHIDKLKNNIIIHY